MVGNQPNYSKMDILRCFLRLGRNTSRKELAKNLKLGEGTTRTILDILKSRKLLDSTKKGHFLSRKGTRMLEMISNNISVPKKLGIKEIYPEYIKFGVRVRDVKNLRNLYNLRDTAVKNGADGAVILKFENKLYVPESGENYRYEELEKIFEFKNNDILVVGFSHNKRAAENGALSIAVELSSILQKFINEF